MMRRMSVLHQNSGGIGKSIPSANKISLDPRNFPWALLSGNLSGLRKSLGRRGWISQYLPRLVEHGYDMSILMPNTCVDLIRGLGFVSSKISFPFSGGNCFLPVLVSLHNTYWSMVKSRRVTWRRHDDHPHHHHHPHQYHHPHHPHHPHHSHPSHHSHHPKHNDGECQVLRYW